MGIRAFLDKSGQKERRYVTLAAFAGPDETWAEFEAGWNVVLTQAFRPVPYFHVVEALSCRYRSPFSYTQGWTRKHALDLLVKLIQYIGQFNRGRLTMHSCVIDMDAWRELSDAGCSVPSEIDLCNKYVSEFIVGCFAHKLISENHGMPIISLRSEQLLTFVFDRNEQFREPFGRFVNEEREKANGAAVSSIWQLVDGIGEDDMKRTPGLQAADIFAWGINRENTVAEGEDMRYLAHILRQIVVVFYKEYSRDALLAEFGPPAGGPR